MDRLAYTSLSAVISQAEVRAQLTHSLSNVSTVGFKESYEIASQTAKVEGDGFETLYQPLLIMRDVIKLNPGTVTATGNQMDVALNDKTVLGMQTENGEIAFTRRGDLRVTVSGVIENSLGQLVLGEAGPISVPPGQLVSISADGTVYASSPANPEDAPVEIGQLMLRDASNTPLVRREDGLFEPLDENYRGKDFPSGPRTASLRSGALEGSNVNPINAMVKLMDFSRSFEAQINVVKQAESIDETGSTMMRLP
jgi:flagellar basal-body rod protein FlgF